MIPLTTFWATFDARTLASGRKSVAIVVVKPTPATKAAPFDSAIPRPGAPASQSGLCGVISRCGRTADIPEIADARARHATAVADARARHAGHRIFLAAWPSLVAREPASRTRRATVYLAAFGTQKTLDDLDGHRAIGFFSTATGTAAISRACLRRPISASRFAAARIRGRRHGCHADRAEHPLGQWR